ncbi:putative oxidoreductase [Medicago truncatula]|uniref:Putative oxidoreductase n=1 Tax=Medicago truncatula TaxID=3880 RepID=A0A396HXA1_MEDTR|nr:putative oxidoreductase [Medicago truncatula]
MYLKTSTISLQLPKDASEAVLVKNLVLSCDPYMRGTKRTGKNNLFYSFSPDSVSSQLLVQLSKFYYYFLNYTSKLILPALLSNHSLI